MKRVNMNVITYGIAISALVGTILLTGCGSAGGANNASIPATSPGLPQVGTISNEGIVIKSRAMLVISGDSPSLANYLLKGFFSVAYAASGNQTVTVVNSPNSTMTLDTSQWLPPSVSNAVLDFGNLNISALSDNNLKVCGTGTTKCNNALIQIYTTGQTGAGLWNTVDGYGAPVSASVVGSGGSGTVGLNTAGAYTLETISINSSKHVLSQTDFNPTPKYDVKVDFTNAGAGTYSTTLVIQYGLSL